MYRLNPNNKFSIPSGNLSKMFNGTPESAFNSVHKENLIRVEAKHETPIPVEVVKEVYVDSEKVAEDKHKADFEMLVRDKLGKIDEILIALKDKQDAMMGSEVGGVQTGLKAPPADYRPIEIDKKQPRSKRTYYPITTNMWQDVKGKFPDLPEDIKPKVFSDGENYYIDTKNKKTLLDNKALLKLLNKKN
jgi:hypothetical protein